MLRGAVAGVLWGSVTVYLDQWITKNVLGIEVPIFILFGFFTVVMALIGLMTSPDRARVLATAFGVPVGIFACNWVRMAQFGAENLLAPLGIG